MRNLLYTGLFSLFLSTTLTVSSMALAESKIKKSSIGRHTNEKINSFNKESQDYARFELRTAPLAFLADWITMDASYRLSKNHSFGPSVIVYNSPKEKNGRGGILGPPSYHGYAAGLNNMYYFKSVSKNTGYTSFHLYYEDYSIGGEGDLTERYGFKANTAIGYQWRWSKITMLFGGGMEYRNFKETDTDYFFTEAKLVKSDEKAVQYYYPFIEFKVGIEF